MLSLGQSCRVLARSALLVICSANAMPGRQSVDSKCYQARATSSREMPVHRGSEVPSLGALELLPYKACAYAALCQARRQE